MMVHEQLALPLPVETAYGADDFFVSQSNMEAVRWLETWPDRTATSLILTGSEGAGKTHLARVWAEQSSYPVLTVDDLETVLNDLGSVAGCVLDGGDQISDRPAPQTALFHLFNHLKHSEGRMVITARNPVTFWGFCLPDLMSRLQASPSLAIGEPDDALLQAVIAKQFADRGVKVTAPLLSYLCARMDRSFTAARKMVVDLDAYSLRLGRPITRDLARNWFEQDPAVERA